MTIPEQIQKPTYPQFTNLALNEGLFDQLMASVQYHLDKQYEQNRLRGDKYAEVYVGSMQGVLQNVTTYLLGIMLIDEQKAKAEAEISLIEKQEDQLDVNIDLAELEKIKQTYQIEEMLPLEKTKLEWEVLRTEQEYLLVKEQILKVTAEIAHMAAQQLLWDKQKEKLDADILLVNAQTSLTGKQEDKIDKEIEFLTAKILTEQANTMAGVAASDSLIGRQMSLLAAQKLGFAGDLQVKAAKLIADYDAVFQGVQETPGDSILSTGGRVGADSEHDALGGISSAKTTAAAIALV